MKALFRITGMLAIAAIGVEPAGATQRSLFQVPLDTSLVAAIMAAEDGRYQGGEMQPILDGLHAQDPSVRRMAARAVGRLERPTLAQVLIPVLSDDSPLVRAEAANAVAQAVSRVDPEPAAAALIGRIRQEDSPVARGAIAQSLGRMPHASTGELRRVEMVLRELALNADANAIELLGVARGLESLVRRNAPDFILDPATVSAVKVLARYGRGAREGPDSEVIARIRRLAFAALTRGDFLDRDLSASGMSDPDFEVRRLLAAGFGTSARMANEVWVITALTAMLQDRAAPVRYEALRAYGRWRRPPAGCVPLFEAAAYEGHTALLAVDLLADGCTDGDRLTGFLFGVAQALPEGDEDGWHAAAHALVSLSRVAPGTAAELIRRFSEHRRWQVRMYGARAATIAEDERALLRLADDPHHNVREAAVRGLARVAGHRADSVFVAALDGSDYQLLIAASRALEGSPVAGTALPKLIEALRRITAQQRETSRDARRALLVRIGEFGGAGRVAALRPYLEDFDPVIAREAASILTGWTGTDHVPVPVTLPRGPLPSVAELQRLAEVRVFMAMRGGGVVELRLLPFEAPTNAARFARLAEAGHFEGLTFHRVVPNFVIQGGSPGANEYSGEGAFTRDEVTTRSHLRGTVGLSTRGRDTGDAQIFVNLVDNVRLDHDYTIFGEIVGGMDEIDGILEGAVIDRVWLQDE